MTVLKSSALTGKDVSQMVEVHAASFAEPWSAETLTTLLQGHGCFSLGVLRPGGPDRADPSDKVRALWGFILLRVIADEAEILTFAVAPSSRRIGVGALLLGDAMLHCGQRGARNLFLEVSEKTPAALALYAGFGLEEVARRKDYYAKQGTDAVVLRVSLRSY